MVANIDLTNIKLYAKFLYRTNSRVFPDYPEYNFVINQADRKVWSYLQNRDVDVEKYIEFCNRLVHLESYVNRKIGEPRKFETPDDAFSCVLGKNVDMSDFNSYCQSLELKNPSQVVNGRIVVVGFQLTSSQVH